MSSSNQPRTTKALQHAKAKGAILKEKPKEIQPKVTPPVLVPPADQPRASSTVKSVMDIFYSSEILQKMYADRCVAMFNEFIKGDRPYPRAINTLPDITDFVVTQRNFVLPTGKSLCEEFFLATFAALSTDKRKKKEKEPTQPCLVEGKQEPPAKKLNSVEASQGKIFPIPSKPGKANVRAKRTVNNFGDAIATYPRFLEFFPNPRQHTFSSNGGLHPVIDCKICAEFGFYNSSDATGKKRLLLLPQKIYIARIHDMVEPNGSIKDWTGFDAYLDARDNDSGTSPPLEQPPATSIDEAMVTDDLVIHSNESWESVPGE